MERKLNSWEVAGMYKYDKVLILDVLVKKMN
jgi:hypothetical protein